MKKSNNISDYMLESYLVGELPDKYRQAVEVAIREDQSLKKRITRLKKSNREILHAYPQTDMVAEIKRKLTIEQDFAARKGQKPKQTSLYRKWLLYPSLALGCIIVTVIMIFFLTNKHTTNQQHIAEDDAKKNHEIIDKNKKPLQLAHHNTNPYYGIKGLKTEIIVHRKKGNHIETLTNGAAAKAGDLIQLAYTLTANNYGAIVSIDGRGSVTVHYPLKTKHAIKFIAGRKVNLPTAFELDDAPDFERFFLITAKQQFSINSVIHAARTLASNARLAQRGNLPLANSLQQVSVLIIKGK